MRFLDGQKIMLMSESMQKLALAVLNIELIGQEALGIPCTYPRPPNTEKSSGHYANSKEMSPNMEVKVTQ